MSNSLSNSIDSHWSLELTVIEAHTVTKLKDYAKASIYNILK